jgi:hypothetical protein
LAEGGGLNQFQYTNDPIDFVDPMGTLRMKPSQFETHTGYENSAAAIQNAGCRGAVDSALGIQTAVQGAYTPESVIFNPRNNTTGILNTRCFWGGSQRGGDDPTSAAESAKKECPCPPGYERVIWCKQFNLENGRAGIPGSAVGDPLFSMSTPSGGETYNYSVWTPGGYRGANRPGPGQFGYVGEGSPIGTGSYGNVICCRSCIKQKGRK